ncbi:Uncharacterized protein QTN25_010767 [Entamoeba marina]
MDLETRHPPPTLDFARVLESQQQRQQQTTPFGESIVYDLPKKNPPVPKRYPPLPPPPKDKTPEKLVPKQPTYNAKTRIPPVPPPRRTQNTQNEKIQIKEQQNITINPKNTIPFSPITQEPKVAEEKPETIENRIERLEEEGKLKQRNSPQPKTITEKEIAKKKRSESHTSFFSKFKRKSTRPTVQKTPTTPISVGDTKSIRGVEEINPPLLSNLQKTYSFPSRRDASPISQTRNNSIVTDTPKQKYQTPKKPTVLEIYSKLYGDLLKAEQIISGVQSVIFPYLQHCIHHRTLTVYSLLQKGSAPFEGLIMSESFIDVEGGIQNYFVASEEATYYVIRAALAIYDSLDNIERQNGELYLKGEEMNGDAVELLKAIKTVLVTEQEVETSKNCVGWELLENVRKIGENVWGDVIKYWSQMNQFYNIFGNVDLVTYPVFGWGRSLQLKQNINCWDDGWKEMELYIMQDVLVIKTNEIQFFSELEWTDIKETNDYITISNIYRGNYYIKPEEEISKQIIQMINKNKQNDSEIYVFPLEYVEQ